MSDTERLWEAIRLKWPTPLPVWAELHPQRQMMILQSLNLLIYAAHMPND